MLDTRLAGREYLAGPGAGKYTIADINAFPWFVRNVSVCSSALTGTRVSMASFLGIDSFDPWPNVKV